MTRWWPAAMVVVSSLLLVSFTVGYVAREGRTSDLRWCALLDTLDSPEVPPTTERGLKVQREVHALRARFGCAAP